PFRSPVAAATGPEPTPVGGSAVKVPSPFPSRIEIVLSKRLVRARSSLPSRLKSPAPTHCGPFPVATSNRVSDKEAVEFVTGKKTTLDVPPPGTGFTTVIQAVAGTEVSVAGTVAVNCRLLTKLVARLAPFQLIVLPGRKPVPFTVSVNPEPPGAALPGTTGRLI